MNFTQVMAELKKCGTAQNVKIYGRHGAQGKMFGVSFANLNALKKKIKVDHGVAVQLWASGNMDARTLATMIADPSQFKAAEADKWVKDLDYYLLADLFAGLVAKTSFAQSKMKKWMKSKKEFVRVSGYSLLATLLRDKTEISDIELEGCLKTIEKEIHSSANRARHSMNGVISAIGIFRPKMAKAAIATAKRIGKVEVDHGETSCTTPDAAAYIEKALKRKKK